MRLTAIHNPKLTISVSGELKLLQMILELVTERCASEGTESQRRVYCEISYRLEMETSVSQDVGPQKE